MLRDEIKDIIVECSTETYGFSEHYINVDINKAADAILALVEPDEEKVKHTIKSNVGGYPCEISSWQVSQIVAKIMRAWREGRLRKEPGKGKA